jgi:hypothetical protein
MAGKKKSILDKALDEIVVASEISLAETKTKNNQ